jgi:2-methylcitrate dehydratase PrpD
MTTPLTRGLARWIASESMAVPADVLPILRNAMIDTLAALLSGRDEAVTRAALAYAGRRQGEPAATALPGMRRLHVADAAFVNGVSAHALDYDDMALNGHPSVVLIPALLAQGEACGASDSALLRAYLAGYETWAELAAREPDPLHSKGWHPTSVIGTVAAAAALCHLLALPETAVAHALGIAASLSCGLMGNFGSMTKPLHAGWAAAHAIEAVHLAQAGATASPNVLEAPTGFLAAFSPQGRARRDEWSPPPQLRIRKNGLSIKKYPVCYASHRVIDGVLDLRAKYAIRPEQVERIEAAISDVNVGVLHSHAPRSALEAKFSLEFACAMSLCDGAVGLAQVTDAQALRPDIQALMTRVRILGLPAGCPVEPSFALHDRVTVHLRDGRVLDSGDIRFARGHAQLPLTDAELDVKFLGCAGSAAPGAAQSLLATLRALGDVPEATLLPALARFASPPARGASAAEAAPATRPEAAAGRTAAPSAAAPAATPAAARPAATAAPGADGR